jgi:hypothetical protein
MCFSKLQSQKAKVQVIRNELFEITKHVVDLLLTQLVNSVLEKNLLSKMPPISDFTLTFWY